MTTVFPHPSSLMAPCLVFVSGDLADPVDRSLFTREVARELDLAARERRQRALQASLDRLMEALDAGVPAGHLLVAQAGRPVVDAGPVPAPTRARLIVHTEPPPWVRDLLAPQTAA